MVPDEPIENVCETRVVGAPRDVAILPVPSKALSGVSIATKGATWSGSILSADETGFLVEVDGFPPLSDGLHLSLATTCRGKTLRAAATILTVSEERSRPNSSSSAACTWLRAEWNVQDELCRAILMACEHGVNPALSIEVLEPVCDDQLTQWNVKRRRHDSNGSHSMPATRDTDVCLQQACGALGHVNSPCDALSEGIVSDRLDVANGNRERISAFHDHRASHSNSDPSCVVILAPGYGETKREYITLAYYLACNDIDVLRYDHTNHVGDSDGKHEHTTLSRMREDMEAMVAFARTTWPSARIGLVSTSLAGRVALKFLSQQPSVDFAVVIAGIVHVQATLTAVHQEDLVAGFQAGKRKGCTSVLGFNVEADAWLQDSVQAGYATLESTRQDMNQIHIPMLWFLGDHDAWVDRGDVEMIWKEHESANLTVHSIPQGLHRLLENPRKARSVYRTIVGWCQQMVSANPAGAAMREPTRRMIGFQNRIERDWSRANPEKRTVNLVHFWQDYLDHFHFISEVGDYRALLDHVWHLLDVPEGPVQILDAGCGNGAFLKFVSQFLNRSASEHGNPPRLRYVGVDFVHEALQHARRSHWPVGQEATQGGVSKVPPSWFTSMAFVQADLNQPLPFRDGQFARIVSNLVIGYLDDPTQTLRELIRVLSPSGKLVITNLKPHSDLTQVYRNFVRVSQGEQVIEEGRQLLNNSGKIRQAESDGFFRFFDKSELETVLRTCGLVDFAVHATFANQAWVAVATKSSARGVNRSRVLGHPSVELAA